MHMPMCHAGAIPCKAHIKTLPYLLERGQVVLRTLRFFLCLQLPTCFCLFRLFLLPADSRKAAFRLCRPMPTVLMITILRCKASRLAFLQPRGPDSGFASASADTVYTLNLNKLYNGSTTACTCKAFFSSDIMSRHHEDKTRSKLQWCWSCDSYY